MNDEPSIRLVFDEGKDFLATPRNAELFQFIGRQIINGEEVDLSQRTHVFLTREREGKKTIGSFIFQRTEVFPQLSKFMIDNDFPLHLNLQNITASDEKAYQDAINQLVDGETADDFVPGDW